VTPHLLRVAYGIQPLLDSGIDGRGETVTVLAPAPGATAGPAAVPGVTTAPPRGLSPSAGDIRQDLAAFDRMFRLPAARVRMVTTLAGSASPWRASDQEVQETEIVHAIAPGASLRVVLLPADVLLSGAAHATADMIAGLRLAVAGTDVASIGFSLGEHYFARDQVTQMHAILRGAAAHHVTVVASSGTNGAFSDNWFGGTPVKEVSLPAADPLVLAVGGTTLFADPLTGSYVSETAWNGDASYSVTGAASGGGFSRRYSRPAYQRGVPGTSAKRGIPDVAGDADQNSGIPIVFADGSRANVAPLGGISAATPLWGGLMALADQDAHHALGFVNPAIYRIARGPGYHKAFHDVTTGSNTLAMPYPAVKAGYRAGPGWDPATGWGTPNAQALIPLLAHS
jgi:subtilase family serine protease